MVILRKTTLRARPARIRTALRRLLRERRGAVAAVVAIGATSVVGMASFAIDAGGWYLTRRSAQNAADYAALSAVRVFADTDDSTTAIAAGQMISTRNGYQNAVAQTTVTIAPELVGGGRRVRATISQVQPLILAGAVLNVPKVVTVTAVAEALEPPGGGACGLTLSGPMSFGGTGSFSGNNCAMASNATPNSFQFGSGQSQGGSSFTATAWSLVGSGDSTSFIPAQVDGQVSLTGPQPAFFQQPVVNPYATLDAYTPEFDSGLANMASGGCISFAETPSGNPDVLNAPSGSTPYCGTSLTGNGRSIVLTPGTYFIRGDLSTNPGTTLRCSGCNNTGTGVTIVVLGRIQGTTWNPGALDLRGLVQLNAQSTNSVNANLAGVLFYVPGGDDVTITANATTVLGGGIVAPESELTLIGNATASGVPISNCTVLIAGSMNVSGTSALSVDGCGNYGTLLPQVTLVSLIE
ncbi:pilus assembly protein TadG-related protein [Falsiroseomonas sp.]|uniref:pilus assembly protein TadG-related protein n=1 Tax=Falsiroseomonas sp. TaxID=2870721 RepID=UPI003563F349